MIEKSFCNVYLKKIDFGQEFLPDLFDEMIMPGGDFAGGKRRESFFDFFYHIKSTKNKALKTRRYQTLLLLDYAISDIFGRDFYNFKLKKDEFSKWLSDEFCLSISHSGEFVSVAISNTPVGVDIEEESSFFEKIKDANRLFKRICTKKEQCEILGLEKDNMLKFLVENWTKKGSIFKAFSSDGIFSPQNTDVKDYSVFFSEVLFDDKIVALSVASNQIENLKIIKL